MHVFVLVSIWTRARKSLYCWRCQPTETDNLMTLKIEINSRQLGLMIGHLRSSIAWRERKLKSREGSANYRQQIADNLAEDAALLATLEASSQSAET